MYSCGPTVYSSPHIGNMYAYIVWDVLVRVLEHVGYNVRQVVNVTDVGHLVADSDDGEDKMEKGSRITGLSAWDLAKKYEAEFVDNLDKLNIKFIYIYYILKIRAQIVKNMIIDIFKW